MGSPRIGSNTDVLMDRALEGAKASGATVEKVILDQLDVGPCLDCEGCAVDGNCTQADDMIDLHEKIRQADGLIMGTPIYWWGPTAQMKAFIDRWYAIARDVVMHRLVGKKAALIYTFGDSDAATAEPTDVMFTKTLEYLQMPIVGRVYASAWKRGDIFKSPEKLDEAYELGQIIANSQ
jgi:multimeric flavodoxin WrbA